MKSFITFRVTLLRLAVALCVGGFAIAPSPVSAQNEPAEWSTVQNLIGLTGSNVCVVGTGSESVATLLGFGCLLFNVLVIALRLLGLVMFIMIVVGGFKYLTAGDDPKGIEAAKGTITAAITGLVLAILAWFILVLISQFTGLNSTGPVDITKFNLTIPQ